MTSTRGNPRLGQSRSSLTSLGAVGGPRGTAAGALRVLIEFLTEYDPTAIKNLEADLQSLTQLEEQLGLEQIKIADKVAKVRTQIAQREALQRAKITDREAKKLLKQSEALRATGVPKDIKQADQLLQLAIQKSGVTQKEASNIRGLIRLRTQLANLEAKELAIAKTRAGVSEQQEAVETELATIKGFATTLPSKLGGLALGAVGGLLGGAVLGAGFAAAQAAIDAIGEALLNVIDPARQAREQLEDVAGAIISIADASEGLSDENAALQFLRSIGIAGDPATAKLLATATAAERAKKFIDDYMSSGLVASQADALYAEQVKRLTDQLFQEAYAVARTNAEQGRYGVIIDQNALRASAEAEAIYRLSQAESIAADEAQRLAEKQELLQKNLEATAILARFAAEQLQQTVAAAADTAFINPLSNQIDALQGSDFKSKRTAALEAAIERAQGGGGSRDAGKQRELANIAEERTLILLRQRLRLLGTNIDLEKFEGKFLLEAINAKIKALQKQSDAQERLNKQLDLQFRMSQVLRRQQGESINDFLERRAQENRELLAEQQKLEQERIIESLNDQKEKVEDEVALQELAERKKTASTTAGTNNRIKQLQKELEASRKADKAALDAKIKALKQQEDAQKAAAANAAKYAAITANEEIRQAARAANSVEKIATLSGEARGLTAAKSFLQALLQSGVLRGNEVAQVRAAIDRINKTLGAIGDAQYSVMKNALQKNGPPIAFAEGGFIPLTAASKPFGSNARFGEEGTEGGMMVFPTRMYNKMKGNGGPAVENLTINRSTDPLRDEYKFRKIVREEVRRELSK